MRAGRFAAKQKAAGHSRRRRLVDGRAIVSRCGASAAGSCRSGQSRGARDRADIRESRRVTPARCRRRCPHSSSRLAGALAGRPPQDHPNSSNAARSGTNWSTDSSATNHRLRRSPSRARTRSRCAGGSKNSSRSTKTRKGCSSMDGCSCRRAARSSSARRSDGSRRP